jgi:hypothetical protein
MYRLGVALALAATLALAACGAQRPDPPAPAPPTRTIPRPTLSPSTTLLSSPPRLLRKVGRWFMFEATSPTSTCTSS